MLGASSFIIIADSLRMLNLPSVPGIPIIAGFGEIPYSIIVVAYLLQGHIKREYGLRTKNKNRH